MIKQTCYIDPVLGNVYEVKQTDAVPDDIKEIVDFPENYKLLENGNPITLICNVPWIAINLALYMRENGCCELRFATKKSGPFTVVFDDYEIEREGEIYDKSGQLIQGSDNSFEKFPKITDNSEDIEF